MDYGSGYILSDETFNGKEYKIAINIREYQDEADYLIVLWRNISRDLYLYTRSTSSRNEELEGFSEPVSIHNNVSNGLGIFGLRTEQLYELEE